MKMPAESGECSLDVDELNRLTSRGLSITTAVAVANGKMDEAFEVACVEERRVVHAWCKGRKNIPSVLTAVWDCDPEHFYLAFDGELPGEHAPADFVLINADVADVDIKLTYAASRDKDPWHKCYKSKSCGIAYRWLHDRGVTPPLLSEYQGQVHIVGGMHRFHLAKHYGTTSMPFLVRKAELTAVTALIPSAAEIAGTILHEEPAGHT